jgi:hypothetical protein
MVSLAKKTMHQRPTYETLVRDTILEPHDKINLPNRTATLLRSTQKLNQFDDESFLDLDEENKRIAAERMQQMEFTRMVHESPDMDLKTERATQTQPQNPPDTAAPSPPPPPPTVPKMSSSSAAASSQTKRPPGPSSHPQPNKTQIFDMTIDDDLDDIGNEIKQERTQRKAQREAQIRAIDQKVQKNLGPASSTAEQSFAHHMVDGRRPPRSRSPLPKNQKDTTTVQGVVKSPPLPPPPPPTPQALIPKRRTKPAEATPKKRGKKAQLDAIADPASAPGPQPSSSSSGHSGPKPPPPTPGPKTKPKEKKPPASSGGASSSSGPATSKQASATKKPPTTIPVQKTNLKKGPATLPHPTKINLQQLRDTLFDAANKGRLNPADTKEIMTMADELSPSKKDIKKRPKKVIHDKMREMYAKYWKTLTP